MGKRTAPDTRRQVDQPSDRNDAAIDEALGNAFGDDVEVSAADDADARQKPQEEPSAESEEPTEPQAEAETGDEPTAEPGAPAPAPQQPADDGLSPVHRAALQKAGIDPSMLASMDPAARKQLADAHVSQMQNLATQYAAIGQPGAQPPAQPQPQAPQPGGQAPPQAPASVPGSMPQQQPGGEPAQPSDDEVRQQFGIPSEQEFTEDYGEEMVNRVYKPMMAMAKAVASDRTENTRLREIIDGAQQAQEVTQSVQRELYDFFNKPDFKEDYGSGHDWNVSSQQLNVRRQVMNLADSIHRGAQQSGRPISIRDSLELAQLKVLNDRVTENSKAEGRKQATTQANRSMHPPGRSASPARSRTPEDKAKAAIGAKAEELGIPWGDG